MWPSQGLQNQVEETGNVAVNAISSDTGHSSWVREGFVEEKDLDLEELVGSG